MILEGGVRVHYFLLFQAHVLDGIYIPGRKPENAFSSMVNQVAPAINHKQSPAFQ
jgi:hypothetical protein